MTLESVQLFRLGTVFLC